MSRWIRFIGIVGLVILGVAVLATFALGVGIVKTPVIAGHFIIGTVAIFLWFGLYGVRHLKEAGGVLGGRQARFGYNAVAYLLVFIGLISTVNWFVVKHDKKWDFTEESVYSLSAPSERILAMVKRPLKLVGFKVGGWEGVEELLGRYRGFNSSLIHTEMIDPRSKPHLVDSYQMKPGNLLYIAYGEGDSAAISRVNETTEDAISNAILKLVRGEGRKIYYVEGHGEPALSSADEAGVDQWISAIRDQQIMVESLIVSTKEKVPDDASAVLLVAPKKSLLPQERKALINYARGGGRLVLFTDPRGPEDATLIAKEFGIEVGDDVILDQVQQLFAGPALAVQFAVQRYEEHPITQTFGPESVTVVQLARSVRIATGSESAGFVTELAKSSDRSFAMRKTGLIFDEPEPRVERTPDDLSGPVSIAAVYEKKLVEGAENKGGNSEEAKVESVSRVVVVGDSDLITNGSFNLYSNRDFALNIINWAVGQEGGVTIKPRSLKVASEPLKQSVFGTMFVASLLIPELVLLLGLFIWFSRREVSLN